MIEILTILHTLPSVQSYRTLCFERILPKLRNKTDVHITWLVYQPERLNIESTIDEYSTILDSKLVFPTPGIPTNTIFLFSAK